MMQTAIKTLLQIRENRRDQHRVRLAKAMREDEALAQYQAELAREHDQLLTRYREAIGPGVLDVDCLIEYRHYEKQLADEQRRLEKQRRQTARRINRRRAALLAADREARAIEKFEEKQQEQRREEENRRQMRWLDEMASHHREV